MSTSTYTFTSAEKAILLQGLQAIPSSAISSSLQQRFQHSGTPSIEDALIDNSEPQQASRRGRSACHRNGTVLAAQARWRANEYVGQSSNISANGLLAALSVPNFASSSHNPRVWLRSIRDALLYCCTHQSRDLGTQDLASIIWRCVSFRSKEIGMNFLIMLSFMQLAFKCER